MKLSALKAARFKAGFTQIELAAHMDVAPSTVAGWELGTHSIRAARLAKLARVLKTSVEKLVA